MIYLASPYSDPDPLVREQRYLAACKATAALMRDGELVFSPIAHSHHVADYLPSDVRMDFDFWQRQDREVLRHCDRLAVLLLEGWDKSKGVTAEIHLAQRLGLRVEYVAP